MADGDLIMFFGTELYINYAYSEVLLKNDI